MSPHRLSQRLRKAAARRTHRYGNMRRAACIPDRPVKVSTLFTGHFWHSLDARQTTHAFHASCLWLGFSQAESHTLYMYEGALALINIVDEDLDFI